MASICLQSFATSGNNENNNYRLPLIAIFFLWGFITVLNDVIPRLKGVFDLNTEAMLIQFCFSAYFIVSLPAGYLVKALAIKMAC